MHWVNGLNLSLITKDDDRDQDMDCEDVYAISGLISVEWGE